jgi:hypothetical protein
MVLCAAVPTPSGKIPSDQDTETAASLLLSVFNYKTAVSSDLLI